MADNSNNFGGGLMNLRDPDLLMNAGLGLMSAAKYGGNVGDGLSQALGNYQKQKIMHQQMQMGQFELARQRMMLGAAQQEFGGQGPGQQPQGPQGPMPQGMPQMPQGAPMQVGNPPQMGAPQAPPNFLQPPDPNSIYGASVGGVSPGYLRGMALLSGRSPLPDLNSLREQQLKLAQQQQAPKIAKIDSVVSSDDPVRDINADPELAQTWTHYAVARGLNPKDLNAQNARQVFAGVGNAFRSSLMQPEKAPPEIYDELNVGGGLAQRSRVTGKEEMVAKPEFPRVELKETHGPTGEVGVRPVQTAPGWYPGASAGQAPGAPSVGGSTVTRGGMGAVGKDVPLGYGAPSAENNKAAMFGSEMRAGLQTLTQMEGQGYRMSPKARAFAISMATDESAGPISQLSQQELAAHGLTPKDQVYIAGMMPLLQAAGHDQSGARLTTAQIRQNVESLLPLGNDPANLSQVQKNREGFYQGLLSQAGPALQNPKYSGTLLADEKRAEKGGGAEIMRRSVGGKNYYKQNGKWYAE